jgi:hypothetical protein
MSKMVAMRNSPLCYPPASRRCPWEGPGLSASGKSRTELGSNLGDLEAVGPCSAMRFTGAPPWRRGDILTERSP